MSANDHQVGGNHYRKISGEQHWDRATRLKFDHFQYIITKWVERWKDKGGVEDLKKAQHAIEKYIEVHEKFLGKNPPSLEDFARDYNTLAEIQGKFVWEGSKEGTIMFTCKKCRGKVYAKNVIYAFLQHRCPVVPIDGKPLDEDGAGRAYVDQG